MAVARNPATGVTAQQEEWCFQCVRLGDPNKAYRVAYNAKDMSQAAVRVETFHLQRNPKVMVRMQHYQDLAERKLDVKVERIAQELARIGFADPADLCDEQGNQIPLHMLPLDVRRAIQSVKVIERAGAVIITEGEPAIRHERVKEIRFWSKMDALNTMAKWKKMLVDQVEHGKPGQFEDKDELKKRIKGRMVRLGLAKVVDINKATKKTA